MRVIQLSAKAGADGRLHLDIPAEAGMEFEVAVVLTANGAVRETTPEELGWPQGYFEATYGSIQDERFVAPVRTPARFDGSLE